MVETNATGRGVIPQVIILYMAALFKSLPGSISLNGLSAVKPWFSGFVNRVIGIGISLKSDSWSEQGGSYGVFLFLAGFPVRLG